MQIDQRLQRSSGRSDEPVYRALLVALQMVVVETFAEVLTEPFAETIFKEAEVLFVVLVTERSTKESSPLTRKIVSEVVVVCNRKYAGFVRTEDRFRNLR